MNFRLIRLFIILLFFTSILFCIFQKSPVQSEEARIVSGLYIWDYGIFGHYRVNPPLVRVFASLPTKILIQNYQLQKIFDTPKTRTEFAIGGHFVKNNPVISIQIIRLGRIALLIFPTILLITSMYWVTEHNDYFMSLFLLLLLCTSPMILGNSGVVMEDIPSTSMAVLTIFVFYRWLKRPEMLDAFIAGIILGLAELTKFTLLIFYPLFVVMWLLYRLPEIKTLTKNHWLQQTKQFVLMFVFSILIINMGYLFEGTGKFLGSYRFQTMLFTGSPTLADIPTGGGNRFEKTPLAYIPMPLPSNFIQGIDTQRLDFERGLPSYLRGEWSDHGWQPKQVIQLLDEILEDNGKRWKIDRSRIYLTGMSMGGFGTFRTACEFPERFTAIIPVAGGGEVEKAEQLKNVPTWAFHGDADNIVAYECSSKMIDAMQTVGCREAKLTTLRGAGHGIMHEVYPKPEIYRWLLKKRK